MITEVLGTGFKGLRFMPSLKKFNLIVGPNGVGKSAISQALQLAILGYLPQDGKKQAGAIYEAHGVGGQPFKVGFHLRHPDHPAGIARLYRTYTPNSTGATCEVELSGKRVKANDVSKALAQIGEPKIFDLAEFTSLSDQKKIDLIFDLFPPEGDPAALEDRLAKVSVKINKQTTEVQACTRSIERLTSELSQVQVPAGTLAEVQAEIETKTATLEETRKQYQEISKAEAHEAGKKEAEARAEAEKVKAEAVAAAAATSPPPQEFYGIEPKSPEVKPDPAPAQEARTMSAGPAPVVEATPSNPALEILRSVKDTMDSAGCDACAAAMVLRKGIRQLGGHNG